MSRNIALIREQIKFACECCEVPELADMIALQFNNRFTCRMGDATAPKFFLGAKKFHDDCTGEDREFMIRLSGPLWGNATDHEREDTVIHEACHIIHIYKNPGEKMDHGLKWQKLMVQCGCKPERCHNVDRTGVKRRQVRMYEATCACMGKVHEITQNRVTRMRKGKQYECVKCHALIRLRN